MQDRNEDLKRAREALECSKNRLSKTTNQTNPNEYSRHSIRKIRFGWQGCVLRRGRRT